MKNKTIKMFDEETDFIWGKLLEGNKTPAEEKGFMIGYSPGGGK